MKRLWIACFAAVALTGAFASNRAEAQYMPFGTQTFGKPSTPLGYQSFSPYLNMARGGTNAAINYYGLVKPQMQAQQQFYNLNQQTQALEQQQQTMMGLGGSNNASSTTGHTTYFGNYSHYYPTTGSGAMVSQPRR